MKRQKTKPMYDLIADTILRFVNCSSQQRITYINNYEHLLPYEKVALIQAKKYMTTEEKKAYKEVQLKYKQKSENSQEIEPIL